MANAHIKENILNQVDKLPYDMQIRVLDFANSLSPKGIKGINLSKFRGVYFLGRFKSYRKCDRGRVRLRRSGNRKVFKPLGI